MRVSRLEAACGGVGNDKTCLFVSNSVRERAESNDVIVLSLFRHADPTSLKNGVTAQRSLSSLDCDAAVQ